MDLITTLTSTLTPQTIFSILGGFLGSLIASDRKRYGWQLSLMFIVVAIAASASMGEYLQFEKQFHSIWFLFVINVPLGMAVGSTLDVLRITFPPVIEKVVSGVGNGGASIVIDGVLDKLSNTLGTKRGIEVRDEDIEKHLQEEEDINILERPPPDSTEPTDLHRDTYK